MTKINEVIPAMPQAPDSATDTKTEFNVKADTFVKAWTPHTTSINTWATEANAVATEINSIIASLPDGTIDDTNLSTTSAFSNQHVHDTYTLKSYVAPHSPELQAHLDAGNPMPDWDGADYTDPIFPAGTTAKIYPDGTIRGSNQYGGFVRYPDGTQRAWAVGLQMPNYNPDGSGQYFACPFNAPPSVMVGNNIKTTTGDNITIGEVFDITNDIYTIKFVSSTNIGVGGSTYKYNYQAMGTWK